MSDLKYFNKRKHRKTKSRIFKSSINSGHSKAPENTENSNTLPAIQFSQTDDSITNRNTPDSYNFLNSSGISQLQRYMNANEIDTIPIDASRKKISGLLRNKYKLIRNANRLAPALNINGKRLNSPDSNLNDLEYEVDNLIK